MTKALIQKFLAGSCTDSEKEYVYDWLTDTDNKDEASAILKISWDNASDKMPDSVRSKKDFVRRVLEADQEIKSLEHKNTTAKTPSGKKGTTRILSLALWKVAASIVLIMSLGLVVYRQMQIPVEYEEIAMIEKDNPSGRKSTIILPDGSKVKLNAESKLRYHKNFRDDMREVILEGEAFFEVKKDASRPFVVKTGDIATTVLGTSFNIRAYAKSDQIDVAVVTGKVEVKKAAYYGNEEELIAYLTPNKMASYYRTDRTLSTSSFSMEEMVGWKDGLLIFKNADLTQIADKLKSWYGLEVKIEGGTDLIEKRYTGKFDNNSLEYVLKAITHTSNMSFEIEENKVILKQK